METLIAILGDERTWAALLGLVSVVAAAMPSVGGGRFVVIKRGLEGAKGVFVKKGAPVVLLACGLGLAGPSDAQDQGAPDVGCNGAGCSLYFVSYAWPATIGYNGLEFIKGSFGAGKTGIHAEGDLNYLGGLCLIPKVPELLPLCPAGE